MLPNLPDRSVVVIDNAPYHNNLDEKTPNSSNRKSEIQLWLTNHNIPFSTEMRKVELLDIIKRNRPIYEKYKIDKLFEAEGHAVLRLPPYHPDLNPIENIWGILKNVVADKNTTFKLKAVVKILNEELDDEKYVNYWRAACRHA